jgi:acyl-CoA thioesterase-2
MAALDDLVALLVLEQRGPPRFASRALDSEHRRVYGGQLVAQALLAAGRAVAGDRDAHSLHAYFVKGGSPASSIEYAVEPIRESSAFSTCRVVAEQDGRVLLSLEASFHAWEDGPEADESAPAVAAPDDMVPIDDWQLARSMPDQERDLPAFVDALEYRQAPATLPDGRSRTEHDPIRDVWLRAVGTLPDWPLLHACVIAYASDKPLLGTTVLAPPVCADPRDFLITSLDHSMWFHRRCRADDWLLLHLHSSMTGSARAFARAECFRVDGALAVSATQQGLVRPLSAAP